MVRPMNIAHLLSSTFFGGPERQMLGLAQSLAGEARSVFVSFGEGGRCQAFLDEARRHGFEASALAHDTPHFWAAMGELAALLRQLSVDVLLCHGYKAGILGRPAAPPSTASGRGRLARVDLRKPKDSDLRAV